METAVGTESASGSGPVAVTAVAKVFAELLCIGAIAAISRVAFSGPVPAGGNPAMDRCSAGTGLTAAGSLLAVLGSVLWVIGAIATAVAGSVAGLLC